MPIEVDRVFGCWIWRGKVNGKGYGPHRERWIRHYGIELPPGIQLEHICRRRRCLYPRHLDPITAHENMTRIAPRNRVPSHCPEGHRLLAENTMRTPEGGVVCRLCLDASIADAE